MPSGDFRQQRYSCKFAQLGAMRNLAAQAFSQADEFALAPHRALCAHMLGIQGRAVMWGARGDALLSEGTKGPKGQRDAHHLTVPLAQECDVGG